jgi:CheY-like chemotaxis protein
VKWRNNFKRWITSDLAEVHVAATPQEAMTRLRRQHFDLVLLDLGMDVEDPQNRGNQEIQRYLSTRPEGTLYLVVSAVIEKEEVADAAFRMGASGVIFKSKISPELLGEAVLAAFDAIGDPTARFVAEARHKIIGGVELEGELIGALKMKDASSFSRLIDSVLRRLAPVAQHQYRPRLVVEGTAVLGIVWSRQIGQAVSVALTHKSVPNDEARGELSRWLGYDHREMFHEKLYHSVVRVQLAHEPSLEDTVFDLPAIKAPGRA